MSPLPPLRLALLALSARDPAEAGRWAEEAIARSFDPLTRAESTQLALEASLLRGDRASTLRWARALRALAPSVSLPLELSRALEALISDLEGAPSPPHSPTRP